MKKLGAWTVASTAVLLICAPSAYGTDVTITASQGFCVYNQPCTVDVSISSIQPLGRVAMVLRYDNTKMYATGVTNGNFMPMVNGQTINDVCAVSILCDGPSTLGEIHYIGVDHSNSSIGNGVLFRFALFAYDNTTLAWGPWPQWCNEFVCGSVNPRGVGNDNFSITYSVAFEGGGISYSSLSLIDSDGDGLPDVVEDYIGTNKFDQDSDDDGLMDGHGLSEDLDNDGFVDPGESDPLDPDSDDDGILDGTEKGLTAPETSDTDVSAGFFVPDADPLTTTDPANPDSDGDGVPDGIEDANRNGAYEPAQGESNPEDASSQPPPQPVSTSARVLLLGDGDAEDEVQTALEAAGFDVTLIDYYYDWDGVTPDVNDFDVVVLLDGYDYGYELYEAAGDALQAFVAKGCGFVMTEWTAYDVCGGSKAGAVADLMPVTSAPDCDYDYDLPWLVTGTHALTSSVPASWPDVAASSLVDPYPGTIVLVSTPVGTPLLSFSTENGGTVVHLNHDMAYDVSIEPNALQLLVNAVGFSAVDCPLFTDTFESGNCDSWSAAVGLAP